MVHTIKRDYVYVQDCHSAEFVKSQIPQWFNDYNTIAPHSSLKMKSPREFYENASELARRGRAGSEAGEASPTRMIGKEQSGLIKESEHLFLFSCIAISLVYGVALKWGLRT